MSDSLADFVHGHVYLPWLLMRLPTIGHIFLVEWLLADATTQQRRESRGEITPFLHFAFGSYENIIDCTIATAVYLHHEWWKLDAGTR
jgi:hypothetical protein